MHPTLFHAITLDTDGTVQDVWWAPGEEGMLRPLQQAVGGLVDVVRFADDLDMWIGEESLLSHPVNEIASNIAARFGFTHQRYHGPVVFTGGASGESTRSLDDAGTSSLLEHIALSRLVLDL